MIVFEDEQQLRLNGTMLGAQVEGAWYFNGGKLSGWKRRQVNCAPLLRVPQLSTWTFDVKRGLMNFRKTGSFWHW